jgi:hypothetical protein
LGAVAKATTRPDAFFNGSIDEVAVWNIGQPDSSVSSLWNNGVGRFYATF